MIYCNNCKLAQSCERVWKGEAHSCVGFTPMQTNADKIKAMSNEELAKLIADDWCELVCGDGKDYCWGDCEKQILKWLKGEQK